MADELVTVASFPDVAEAQLARERLESEGIQAFVMEAQSGGVMPFLSNMTGGIHVQVNADDAERAKEVLGS